MKLHHLRNVIAIADRGSLRAAAKHLGLAQPSMSRSIREIERELGVEVFRRSQTGMRLTIAGEALVRHARSIECEVRRAHEAVEALKGVDCGTVTIACSGAAMSSLVPAMARNFHRRFPNVRLKIVEGTYPMVEMDIRDGRIDLFYGPVASDGTDSGLVIHPLFDNGRVILARAGHPLCRARSLAELVDAAWLTIPVKIDHDDEVHAMFRAAGLPPPRIAIESSSAMGIVAIVAHSDLLVSVPEPWLPLAGTTSAVVRMDVEDLPRTPPLCAVRRAGMPLAPAAQWVNDLALREAEARTGHSVPTSPVISRPAYRGTGFRPGSA